MTNKIIQVSIIIPVYNTEKYLRECLDSILDQQLKSYEIIIINDGSTDNSEMIIYEYMRKYHFINYFKQSNSGQGTARNVAIGKAKGKYIYFMDSDDILKDFKFKKMIEQAYEMNLDAIFFDGQSFIDRQSKIDENDQSYKRQKSFGYYSSGEDLFSDLSKNNALIVSPCLYIVKTHIVKDNNLYFPAHYKHEDEYFTTSLFLFLRKCYHVNDIVFLRRIRENSTMTNKNKVPSFKGYVNVLDYFDNFFEVFIFRTKNGKKAYKKKMNQVTKSAFYTYSQIVYKESVEKEFNTLKKFAKKYNYFNLTTLLFIQITKNINLLGSYSKIVNIIKNRKNQK